GNRPILGERKGKRVQLGALSGQVVGKFQIDFSQMASSLIRSDDKHISAAQAIMDDDHVLEGFIYNMRKPAIPKIRGHLQQVGFLHVSRMIGGCKLNLTLISVLVERWRPETQTFHLPYSKCIITLKDVVLQRSLPVDGSIIMGSTVVLGKLDLCRALLGKLWAWWRLPFLRPRATDSYMFLNHGLSYVGLPEELGDFRLLLDQHSKAKFEWMSYIDIDTISCISLKVLENREMWDAKVPLVVYVTVEMHKSDREKMTTIGCNGTGSTSRLRSVGCNPYPSANHFSQRAWQQMLSTYRGLDSSVSRICYHWKGGEGKFSVRGNDDHHSSSIGGDVVT
ncbi:hypothetical protein Golob_021882, partial [Gossypium lobatum]|nr:hypothetical protein [Gossypium lobatum]